MAPTFETVTDVFVEAIAVVFERWEDEHEYEQAEFLAYFQREAADVLGARIDRVSGTKRKIRIDATFPDCRRVLTASWGSRAGLVLDVKRGAVLLPLVCGRCGSRVPAGQSCGCFDNGGQ